MFKSRHIKNPFGTRNAVLIALIGGIVLTGISTMAHINKNWRLDDNYHIIYSLSVNTVIIFLVLIYSFFIIKSHLQVRWKYLLGVVGALFIAVLLSLLSGWIHQLVYDNTRISDANDINLIRDVIVAVVAILIALLLMSITSGMQIRIEKEKLQNEYLMVRYETLENQMDPHFLFNSLNTLGGLIGIDDEKAQQYLQLLASTYRYIMRGKRIVPLSEELEFTDAYCQMMQIRYGDNIRIEKDIDSKYLQYSIIPISIQLLIENALKHNTVSDRYPLTINLCTTPDGLFRVSNTLRPKQEDASGNGLGLANLSKRYRLLSGQDIAIKRQDNSFVVELPLFSPSHVKNLLSPPIINS